MNDTEMIEDRIWLSKYRASILTFPIPTLVLKKKKKREK